MTPDPLPENHAHAGGSPATYDQAQHQAPPATAPPTHKVRRTRIGGVWIAAILFALILLFLLIFILENSHSVSIGYFGAHGHLPLGVALLLAAVLGILLVVVPGTGRIIQLRLTAHRHQRLDAKTTASNIPDEAANHRAGQLSQGGPTRAGS
jgi:uncharacterized integral membrane protein